MSEKISVLDIFEELQDPRRAGDNMIHPLPDLIFFGYQCCSVWS